MIENEDKLLNINLKRLRILKIFISLKCLFKTYINFKKLLEALLLEYIGFTQYEIHF